MKIHTILCLGLAALALSSCTYSDYQEYYTYPYYRSQPPYNSYRNYPYDYRKAPPGGGSAYAPGGGYSSYGGAEGFEAVQRPSTYSY